MAYNWGINDFKFQTFSERIAAVSIDVVHKIKHHDDELGEQSTYFGDAVFTWTDLNCTEHFTNFQHEVQDRVQSFPQLVHNETLIVDSLKKHLLVRQSLAYQPLLDLVVQLARDLQNDFYKHFHDFFEILIQLLGTNGQEADTIEQIFSCLAYLFKFLWRYLVKDIRDVYSLFSALLGSDHKEHIRKFSAESFAFLMRKVKDPGTFFDFLFSKLEDDPDKAEGVGQLLFEMMKGVKKQFHSSAVLTFPVMLSKLGPDGKSNMALPWELVEEALCQTMRSCAEHSTKEFLAPLWNILLDNLSELQNDCVKTKGQKQKVKVDQLCRLLRVTLVWVDYHQGALVCDANQVAEVIGHVLKTSVLPEQVGQPLLSCVSSLLGNLFDKLSMGITAKLLGQVYCRKFAAIELMDFTKCLYDLFLFEKDVLPNLLSYVQSQMTGGSTETHDMMLGLITNLILHKTHTPADGSQLSEYKTINLHFTQQGKSPKKTKTFQQYLMSLLEDTSLKDTATLASLWAALVCLPHCSPMDREEVVKKVQTVWTRLIESVQDPSHSTVEFNMVMYVMERCALSMLLLNEGGDIHTWITWQHLLDLLSKYPSHLNVLKSVDLYLSQCYLDDREAVLSPDTLLDVLPVLMPNLSSWSSQTRLLSLHILSLFPVTMVTQGQETQPLSVIEICHLAERKVVDIHNYRDRVRYLQKLDSDLVDSSLPVGPFEELPLYYLLGNLYINFKLLWEPVRTLIKSYALGMKQETFWAVMLKTLEQAALRAGQNSDQDTKTNKDGSTDEEDISEVGEMFTCRYDDQVTMETPDHSNFRLQLWRTLELFPEKCEERGKDVVQVFLDFVSNEYNKRDLNCASTENLLTNQRTENQSEVEDVEEDEEEDVSTPKKRRSLKKKANKKGLIPTLVAHLDVFSKFRKPKSLVKEQQLRKIYQELLHHKDVSVQKAAFSCVLTYNHKFLNPYKENFQRLLEDKTFKEEIVAFSIDEENTTIKEQHRQNLLPVLMGILYGRMQSRTGRDTTGKSKSNVRRSVVFRFLAGCTSSEIKVFLDLVFEPLLHFVSDNPVAMVKKVVETTDVENIFPVRRMRGILDTALVVVQRLRHLMQDYVTSLLHILLGLAAMTTTCLHHRDQLRPGALNLLKNIRQTIVMAVVQIYQEFESHAFTEMETWAVFEAVVWPQLDKLTTEGVYSPTPLLKLINVWTRHPRYFHLLSVPGKDDQELTPLSALFKLLNAKGCAPSVSRLVLEMVESLLCLEESDDGGEMIAEMSKDDTRRYLAGKQDSEEYGVRLLQPYLPSVLLYLKTSVETVGTGNMHKKHLNFATELKMLAKVSQYVESDAQCSLLCSMLFPFLHQKVKRTRDMEENILRSIVNLTQVLESPKQFYRPVSKLFSVVVNRQSRIYLCDILKILGEKCSEYAVIADVVTKLNAWNPRRSEEPEYTVRLEAFSRFNQSVRDMETINVEQILPVMHNCQHFIHKIDDLSLRDNSTHCLSTIVTRLSETAVDQDTFRDVITQGILPMVKSGLYNKSETVRHEFLSVFGVMVKSFPDHPTFEGLSGLGDKDLRDDFYENIKHIQVQNRVKAMRKLMKYLEVTPLRRELLTSYFLPLTSMVTLDQGYLKIQALREAALDLLATICKLLPWQQYLQQLKFYLTLLSKKVENQKIYVRVVVSVLNAFHFDIRRTELTTGKQREKTEDKGETDAQTEAAVAEEKQDDSSKVGEKEDEAKGDEEEMDVSLGPEGDSNSEPSTEEAEGQQKMELAEDGRQICPAGLATKIHIYVLRSLIPELQKLLTQKVSQDEEHKSVRSKGTDEHEILRVPIALAMIKLLQTLPRGTLQQKLPGILMKVCHFLRSRSRIVRDISRDTLIRISKSLGLRYFNFMLKEMRDALTRGYQLHVLGYSVHRLLTNMEAQLQPGDLDPALHNLSEVFKEELFGVVAEEKDVEGITKKTMEARETKSFDSFEIVSKYVSVGSIGRLIDPVKEMLLVTREKKRAHKIEEVFRRIANGLMENKSLSLENLMVLIHDLVIHNIDQLEANKKEKTEASSESGDSHRPQSCLLLTKAPPRGGEKPKTHEKTNLHIVVEFGLQMLHICLRRSRLVPSMSQHLQLLDPLVEPLTTCLYSKHVKVNSLALRCVSLLLRFPLPSLKTHITRIAQGLFLLLKNYASVGAGKGDNFELIITCFKAMTVLVRDVKYYHLEHEQLQVLVTFCEEDLLDHTRQSTGFSLLKAILHRKLKIKELHELMDKVREMSITESSPNIQLQCRQVFLQYLLDYPMKSKAMGDHLQYYLTQLTFELEHGRVSALEMLATIFSNFPMKELVHYSGLFFVPMSATLVNDESQRCRKLTSLAIRTLLDKIDTPARDVLFSIVSNWMKDAKVTHRTLGYQSCGLFVEVEEESFKTRLTQLLPQVQQHLQPDNFEHDEDSREFEVDHSLFALLTLLSKLFSHCRLIRDVKHTKQLNVIWDHVQSHLLYPHAWCRLTACQLFGQLFASWPVEELKQAMDSGRSKEFLLDNTRDKMLTLSQSFITQLQSELLTEELVNQVVKNMLYLGKVIKILPSGATDSDEKGPSVRWLIRRMIREANHEAVNNPKVTVKRAGVYKWLAAVCMEQDKAVVTESLWVILSTLNRELMLHTNTDSSLKTLVQEVMDLLKKLVGVEAFTEVYSKVQLKKAEKRAGKKRLLATEAVDRPHIAAQRKIKKYEMRKETKKRKIQMLKTGQRPKKMKLRKMAIVEDDH